MPKLKPCPFCGGTPILIANKYRHEQTTYFVKCNNNNCQVIPVTYEAESMDLVIEVWNRRCDDGEMD